ncbi:MAG: hypothetical protein NT094_02410 [Candidatus Staskawiczbacteria bacterium]|nr:hypothetical protein [Candidatus Staskawiczbacteria bacterium]
MPSETKTHSTSSVRACQNCKNEFVIKPEDFDFYEKIKVPAPTFCPDCRLQRRLTFRNERNLYKHQCALCKKQIISMYSPDKPFPVYCHDCWWSDGWDPFDFGMEYDFSKPFFEQNWTLLQKVPRPALIESNSNNCSYCNYFADGKECYLCFGSIAVENCLYGSPYESKYCVDTYLARECEYCYECVDCEKLSNCLFCQDCSNSLNMLYCFDCKNCNDCIGCVGLRSKQYYIFNKSYFKEEYTEKKNQLLAAGRVGLEDTEKKFKELKLNFPHKFSITLQCSDVSGDHIMYSKNALLCFDVKRAKDVKYCKQMIDLKDVYDSNYCEFMELCYEYLGFWKNGHTKFSNTCGESNNLTYSDFCSSSSNLFGCVGLRSKQYCILNKQYTKEEYEIIVPKIIVHMNELPYIDKKERVYKYEEFFPADFSSLSYNETVAQEYYPLTKEQTLSKGYVWKDPDERDYKITKKSNDLPDYIKDIDDSILKEVIECQHNQTCNEQCTQAFKIIPQELQFYKKMNLPLPKLCPNCRHYQRLGQRNPLKLWHRKCMKPGCTNEFETSYAPDRPEIIYCEQCYAREVA